MGVVIPLDGAGNKKRASIEPLVKLTQADMERVNESILSHARSHVELIPEIANHLINSGGKRIRPLIVLAAAAIISSALPRIFAPRGLESPGLGLGLALRLVLAYVVYPNQGMSGDLGLFSQWASTIARTGPGTPCAHVSADGAAAIDRARRAAAGRAGRRRVFLMTTSHPAREPHTVTKTIMTVDDSPSMRMLLRAALTDLGYHVIEAEDGEETLLLVRQHHGRIEPLSAKRAEHALLIACT